MRNSDQDSEDKRGPGVDPPIDRGVDTVQSPSDFLSDSGKPIMGESIAAQAMLFLREAMKHPSYERLVAEHRRLQFESERWAEFPASERA